MIVASKKPIEEVIKSIEEFQNILIAGCNECVTVCEAGGKKEVEILASTLRMYFMNQGKEKVIDEVTLERQCDREYIEGIKQMAPKYDAILSLACGVGVQYMAEIYQDKPVFPGVNTVFMGGSLERGVWAERCAGCGQCILAFTGAVCPVARCAKRLFNGPCGGSSKGKCEINPDTDCAWQLIIDRLKALGRMDLYDEIMGIKDWSKDRAGGPRTVVREDVRL